MYKSTTQVLVHMNMNKTRDSSPWHYWTEYMNMNKTRDSSLWHYWTEYMNMNKTRDSSPWHYWTESWCPDLHAPTTPDDTARAAGIDPQTHSPTPVKTRTQQLKAVNFKCCNKILTVLSLSCQLCCYFPTVQIPMSYNRKDHSHS